MQIALRLSLVLVGLLYYALTSFAGDVRADQMNALAQIPPASSARDDLLWRSQRACGVNCAYLLLKYFDMEVDYRSLEAELLKDELTSLLDLKHAVAARCLATTVVKTDRRGLTSLTKPFIAHLDRVSGRGETSGHFVVVTRVDSEEGVSCIDGTTAAPRTIPWPEFERDWSGYVLVSGARRSSLLVFGVTMAGLGLLLGCLFDHIGRRAKILARLRRSLVGQLRRPTTALTLGLITFSGFVASAADVPSLETITRAYQSRYRGIRTLRADYHAESTALVGQEQLYEIQGTYELPPGDVSAACADNGRLYESLKSPRHSFDDISKWLRKQGITDVSEKLKKDPTLPLSKIYSFAKVSDALKKLSATPYETLKVFDGTRLIERSPNGFTRVGVEQVAYMVLYIPRLKSARFAGSPLDFDLWAFRVPGLPHDDEYRRKHRIPDLFETGPFTVDPAMERVGSDECVVVSSPGNQTLWLLPDKGFAPRKRVLYLNGQKVLQLEFGDWRSVKEGAWIAGLGVATHFGFKGYVPSRYEGLPLMRTTWRLTKLEVNSPTTEDLFRLEFRPGDVVVDENLVEDKRKGKTEVSIDSQKYTPAVAYDVPANRKDLDRVIEKAVNEDRHPDRRLGQSGWLTHPLLWLNVAVVAVIAIAVAVRRLRHA